MDSEFREVSSEEFKRFVREYPNALNVDVCAISEPPPVSYNDFTAQKWPQSMVAKYHDGQPRKYWVRRSAFR